MLEVIKFLQSRGHQNVLLTTDNGKMAYEKLGLVSSDTLKYHTINSYADEQRFPVFISYVLRTFQARKLVSSLKVDGADALFCHSDFFPNSIPFHQLASKHKFGKLICMFHMLAPSIFRGFEGQFTGKFRVPSFSIVHYKLNQWLYFRLIPRTATIITSNSYYAKVLKRTCPGRAVSVLKRFAGANGHHSNVSKVYDLIWMGRFHPQKGLLEIPAIVSLIRKQLPHVQVIILGGGNSELRKKLGGEISRLNLAGNIKLAGFVMGDERYDYLQKSKVFLMTSYYESFGIVSLEAMKSGLPVVAYDLPVYSVFTRGMIKVPILDHEAMARQVMNLLGGSKSYASAAQGAKSFAKDFSWGATGMEVLKVLEAGG